MSPADSPQNVPRGTIEAPSEIDWATVHEKLSAYLDLILKWNARTNLTAVRQPEQIVQRHFGESIFTGLALAHAVVPRGTNPACGDGHIVPRGTTLLDFGSGAGFPGLPIQLLFPQLHVTLAESQGKKAAFLREAVRVLGTETEIWSHRAESMPPDRRFDIVTLRAVDNMESAVREASTRVRSTLAILASVAAAPFPTVPAATLSRFPLPHSRDRILILAQFA